MLDHVNRGHSKGELKQRRQVPAPEDPGSEEQRNGRMHERVCCRSKRATAQEWSYQGAAQRVGETAEKRQEWLTKQEEPRRYREQQDVLHHVGAQPYVRGIVQWRDDRDTQAREAAEKGGKS
jgi:hypothetical protein